MLHTMNNRRPHASARRYIFVEVHLQLVPAARRELPQLLHVRGAQCLQVGKGPCVQRPAEVYASAPSRRVLTVDQNITNR